MRVVVYEIQEPAQIVWDVAALSAARTWKLDFVEGLAYDETYIEFGVAHCIGLIRSF